MIQTFLTGVSVKQAGVIVDWSCAPSATIVIVEANNQTFF